MTSWNSVASGRGMREGVGSREGVGEKEGSVVVRGGRMEEDVSSSLNKRIFGVDFLYVICDNCFRS
jgi:hypothetical protein